MTTQQIYSVVVLYSRAPQAAPGLQTLLRCIEATLAKSESSSDLSFPVLIYDNSPDTQKDALDTCVPGRLRPFVSYVHNPMNPGIAAAYNEALQSARARGTEWILLLDQDSSLPITYLDELRSRVTDKSLDERIVAIVPHVVSAGRIVSPVYCLLGIPLSRLPVSASTTGVLQTPVMAINSCALIRTKFLEEIGGFNKNFPLDGLDHWWCGEAQRLQRKLFVMEGTIEHDLSVSNFGENVTAARYQSIVDSEVTLYRNHRATLTRALFLLQLVRRSIRFFFTMKDRRFAKISLNGALRLFSGA